MKWPFSFNFQSFFGRLLISYLIIIVISLTVIGISFGYLVQRYFYGLKEWDATSNGRRIARLVSENIPEGELIADNLKQAEEKINTIARSSNMDIAFMDNSGEVLYDSTNIGNFQLTLAEEEIKSVLNGNSLTKKIMGPKYKNLLLVFPLLETGDADHTIVMGPQTPPNSEVIGGLVIQTTLGGVAETINNVIQLILYSFLIAIIAALILSISFSRKVTRPLANLKDAAGKISEGTYEKVSVPQNNSEEMTHLVNTFNYAVDQVKKTLEKKKQLEKMQKEFVANASHEFRAPLTSIKGFLELIIDNDLEVDEINEYASIMYKDTEYLEHLLSDLIVLSKLDSESIKLDIKTMNAKELVTRALQSMRNKFDEKSVQVSTNIDDKLYEIKADTNRIYQVLINLIENAITYSPPTTAITINAENIEYKSYDKAIKFSVADEGPGIPESEQEKIWERFYKSNIARTRNEENGSGLGLAIVKEIVEKHGGEVNLDSIPGEGATFSFIIPDNGMAE